MYMYVDVQTGGVEGLQQSHGTAGSLPPITNTRTAVGCCRACGRVVRLIGTPVRLIIYPWMIATVTQG